MNHYEQKKIDGVFNDKYIEHKSKRDKIYQSNNILKKLNHIWLL